MAKHPKTIKALEQDGKYEEHRHGKEAQVPPELLQTISFSKFGEVTSEELYGNLLQMVFHLHGVTCVHSPTAKHYVDDWEAIGRIDVAIEADSHNIDEERKLDVGGFGYEKIIRLRMSHQKRMDEALKSLGLLPMQTRGISLKTDEDSSDAKFMNGPNRKK